MCDSLVAVGAAAVDGVTLFAKNSDRPPSELQVIEWSVPRVETTTATTYLSIDGFNGSTLRCLLSRPSWCWGAEHGVNEAGVAIGNEAIYTTLDPRGFPDALIGMDLVRLGLERASSALAAVHLMTSLLEQYGQGGSGHQRVAGGSARPYWSSLLIADPSDAWVLETSGTTWEAQQCSETVAISNRTCIASFDAAHRHPAQPVERRVDPRRRASLALLERRPVSREAIEAHLRSHDSCLEPGWSVCMHVPEVESTTASMIAALPTTGPPEAWMLLGSPCENVYVPYRF